jgi:CheY-like chemotaxis protein
MATPTEGHYTLLIIDDNIELLEMLTDGLSHHFTNVTAQDGIEGLTKFFEARPDCAIIDVKMPGLDGFQLVRALRGDPETASIPLIILTALNQDQMRFTGLASGVDQFLTKPVMPSELIPAVYQAFALGQEERQRRWRALALDE